MTFRVLVRREAEAEALAAYRWYEAQRVGLGDAFLLSLEACLASVERAPERPALVHHEVRRALVRRFPYGVFYVVSEEEVVVLAVLHLSRSPERWRKRARPALGRPASRNRRPAVRSRARHCALHPPL